LATISLLQAAMARVFFVLATGGGPGLRPGLGHPPLVFNTIVPLLPDIPTVGEFVPGYEASGWIGVGAPKRTSSDIIEKLSKEINAALADPNVKAPCRPGLHGVSKFTP
jgi:hypothetical protein